MPYAVADDGVKIGYQDHGAGEPVIFVHEFGGEPASWNNQVEHLVGHYRCITYAARGFHPSDTPDDIAMYGQQQATNDLATLFIHLNIDRAHVVGTSMGSFTSLDFVLRYPDRVRSLTLVGNSSGPRDDAERDRYRSEWVGEEIRLREQSGGYGAIAVLENDPAYATFQRNLPGEWRAYADRLCKQSVIGAMNILKTLHWNRRSIWQDENRLRLIECPVLLAYGDEDYFLVGDTNRYLESVIPDAERVLFDKTGHLVNIERAHRFNPLLAEHLRRATEATQFS